jgi:aspartyl-tRNA(Asn)/glutamyl-tRNA(Gln) amidotransferase subunit B
VAIDAGETIHLETRGWDEARQSTYHMRPKEEENDYRYFPEPDLPPLLTSPEWLAEIKARLPELPAVRRLRYQGQHGLSAYDADVLVNDAAATALFEGTLAAGPGLSPKLVANWVTGECMRLAKGAVKGSVDPAQLAMLVHLIANNAVSGTNAKEVLTEHFISAEAVKSILDKRGFSQIWDPSVLAAAVDAAIEASPDAVKDYRAGKGAAVGFLVGQVMKATRGQANAAMVQAALRERLDKVE